MTRPDRHLAKSTQRTAASSDRLVEDRTPACTCETVSIHVGALARVPGGRDIPSESEQEEMQPPEDCVEEELRSSELLRHLLAVATHLVEARAGPLLLSPTGLLFVDRRRLAGRSFVD